MKQLAINSSQTAPRLEVIEEADEYHSSNVFAVGMKAYNILLG